MHRIDVISLEIQSEQPNHIEKFDLQEETIAESVSYLQGDCFCGQVRWWYDRSSQYNPVAGCCCVPPRPRPGPRPLPPAGGLGGAPLHAAAGPGPAATRRHLLQPGARTLLTAEIFFSLSHTIIGFVDLTLVFLSADQSCNSLINCVCPMDHGDQLHCSILPHSSSALHPARVHSFARCQTTCGVSSVRRRQDI